MALEAVANPPLIVVPQPPSPAHDRVIRLAHQFQRCCLRLRFANTIRIIWERRIEDIITIERRDTRDDEQVNRLWTQLGGNTQVDDELLRWYILCTEREILGPEHELVQYQPNHDDVHSVITVLLRSLTYTIRQWELERVRLRRGLYIANGALNRIGPPADPLLAVAALI